MEVLAGILSIVGGIIQSKNAKAGNTTAEITAYYEAQIAILVKQIKQMRIVMWVSFAAIIALGITLFVKTRKK